ncbi:2OG-Fe(II) oxygenase [Streptomyces sp. LZ34]
MSPTFSTDDFVIFDDFLSSASLDKLRDHLRSERFAYVKSFRSRSRVFGFLDGDPLVGPSVIQHHPDAPKGAAPYPAGTAMDLFVEAIDEAAESLSPWCGERGNSWDFFTCTPYLYPLGAGLSWHDDAKDRAASYVFYLHGEWKASWGAELLIASRDRADDTSADSDAMNITDFGHYVRPLPNRLVVIKAGTPHAVKRVEVNAGENVRMSVTGFFQALSSRSNELG